MKLVAWTCLVGSILLVAWAGLHLADDLARWLDAFVGAREAVDATRAAAVAPATTAQPAFASLGNLVLGLCGVLFATQRLQQADPDDGDGIVAAATATGAAGAKHPRGQPEHAGA